MENKNQPINPIPDLNNHPSFLLGLTKREYLAGLAMQGLLNNYHHHGLFGNAINQPIVAEEAVKQADELLKQLEK